MERKLICIQSKTWLLSDGADSERDNAKQDPDTALIIGLFALAGVQL